MEDKAYSLYDDLEENNLWFRGRIELISDIILKNIRNAKNLNLADIGCGSGFFLSEVSKYIPNSLGIERHKYNIEKYNNIIELDLFDDSISKYKFDIITFLDVLEHIEVESTFLDRIKNIMNDDGYIVVTVPAYQWLFSYADELYHHYRRYNKHTLTKVLQYNGFEVQKISYFNFLLFPLFAFIRIKDKLLKKREIFYGMGGNKNILNRIVYYLFKIDKYLLRFMNLPFGSSLVAICKLKK